MECISLYPHFNTSHVTVYPANVSTNTRKLVFQYISCYCLSHERRRILCLYIISIHLMLLFIDISRWCTQIRLYFNTSHVTVYLNSAILFSNSLLFQYISCYCLSVQKMLELCWIRISIHLMLLFIGTGMARKRIIENNFNTSHVTVYRDQNCNSRCGWIFQYISCYCLSKHTPEREQVQRNFNTSHVTVYQRNLAVWAGNEFHFNTSHVTVYRLPGTGTIFPV